MSRKFNYSMAELIDRLTVDQIKEVLVPDKKDAVAREMIEICEDIDNIINEKQLKLTAKLLRTVVVIAQINLHIWKFKDEMEQIKDSDPKRYSDLLKLSHQINGIRNRLKNHLLAQCGEADGASLRTNFNVDGLSGWDISL